MLSFLNSSDTGRKIGYKGPVVNRYKTVSTLQVALVSDYSGYPEFLVMMRPVKLAQQCRFVNLFDDRLFQLRDDGKKQSVYLCHM